MLYWIHVCLCVGIRDGAWSACVMCVWFKGEGKCKLSNFLVQEKWLYYIMIILHKDRRICAIFDNKI